MTGPDPKAKQPPRAIPPAPPPPARPRAPVPGVVTPERTDAEAAKDRPDPTRFGDWEKNGRCIDF